MFNYRIFIALTVLCSLSSGTSEYGFTRQPARNDNFQRSQEKSIKIVFYNVENLFHPFNDPLKRDEEFTPRGNHYWSYKKYFVKIQKIAKVLVAMGGNTLPDIIGLCEIENRQVLEDLLEKTALRDGNYGIIHKESPDPRGIDVAFLYNINTFIPENYQAISMVTTKRKLMHTRDILHVWGKLKNKPSCHFFINHWPSRRGGKLESDPKRMQVASQLAAYIDSIYTIDPIVNIVLMGDFNDEPQDRSLKKILGACDKEKPDSTCRLFNLMFDNKRKGEGSHFRKNNFYESSLFDQFIVSRSVLLGINGLSVKNNVVIFRQPFLLNEKNGMPLRTFQGLKYLGGFSDHLPVIMELQISDNPLPESGPQ